MEEWRKLYSVTSAEERVVILIALLMTEELEKKNKLFPTFVKRILLWFHFNIVVPAKRVRYNRLVIFAFIYAVVMLFFHITHPFERVITMDFHIRYIFMISVTMAVSLTIYGITDTLRGLVRHYW